LTLDANVTVISATHDHTMLAASDRVVYLTDGEVVDAKRREDLGISVGAIADGRADSNH
jgi:putative ABC transport system ATP-binding protein